MLAIRTDRRSTPRRGGEGELRTTRDGKGPAARSTACGWPFGPTNSARNAARHFTPGFSPAASRRADEPASAPSRCGDAATRVSQRRCSEAGALRWQGQIARATRGRDLHLNVPFPRKPPDLLMAESPPTGGLSALTGPQPPLCCAAPRQPSHAGPPSSILLGSDSNLAESTLEVQLWDASLEDGPRLAEHQFVEPVHHGLDERESGAGRRRIRAGCRSASP